VNQDYLISAQLQFLKSQPIQYICRTPIIHQDPMDIVVCYRQGDH